MAVKYNEIMSRVSVTPEMRERVLRNIREQRTTKEQGKTEEQRTTGRRTSAHRRIPFRRWAAGLAAATAACILALTGLQVYRMNRAAEETVDVASEGITEYTSLEELEEAEGFSVPELVSLPYEAADTVYSDAFGVARVDYYGADGEDITVSKAKDNGTDISGDYNEYDDVKEETINGVSVTLKGSGGSSSLASWVKDGYAYSIDAIPGVSYESMTGMVQEALED